MINPNLRAKDRIYSELPENLKTLMKQYILSEDEHNIILQDIKKQSYANKKPEANPTFYIVPDSNDYQKQYRKSGKIVRLQKAHSLVFSPPWLQKAHLQYAESQDNDW